MIGTDCTGKYNCHTNMTTPYCKVYMYSTCTSKEKSFWVGEISPSQCDNYGYKLFMKVILVYNLRVNIWMNCIFKNQIHSYRWYYSIQLFNGSTGNRSKYFSRGIRKDQSVLLPEVNRTLWSFPISREELIYCLHSH